VLGWKSILRPHFPLHCSTRPQFSREHTPLLVHRSELLAAGLCRGLISTRRPGSAPAATGRFVCLAPRFLLQPSTPPALHPVREFQGSCLLSAAPRASLEGAFRLDNQTTHEQVAMESPTRGGCRPQRASAPQPTSATGNTFPSTFFIHSDASAPQPKRNLTASRTSNDSHTQTSHAALASASVTPCDRQSHQRAAHTPSPLPGTSRLEGGGASMDGERSCGHCGS
jgi:hypothetical protein